MQSAGTIVPISFPAFFKKNKTGGYNRFVLASLPYDLRDLKRTVQLWHDIDVPLAQLPQYDPDNNYPGIQDARLFTFQNRIYFVSSTQLATPGLGGIADIGPVIGRLSEDRRRVEDAWLPEGTPRQARNLVPLVVGEAAYLLDVLDGLLYRFETPELRTATPVMQFPTLVGLGLRGGTNPVVLDEGAVLGVIAHSVYDVATDASLGFGHLRVDSEYVHFWVELNVLTGRVRVSRPFFLLTSGIEFASSLVLTGDDTQLVIGLGLNDQEAWLMGADLTKVRAMPMLVDDYAVEGSSAAPVEKAAVATGEGRGGRWAGMLSKLLGGRKETQVPVQKGGPGKQAQLGEVAQASAQAAGTGQLQGADGGAADRHVAAAGPGQNSEVQEL